jgi:hypothetical protein
MYPAVKGCGRVVFLSVGLASGRWHNAVLEVKEKSDPAPKEATTMSSKTSAALVIFSIFCSTGIISTDTYAQPGLVAWYKFEEGSGTTALDSGGSANDDGGINGATYATGKVGKALDFDGSDDYVELPVLEGGTPYTAFTIEAWVNLDTVSKSEQDIVSMTRDNGEFGLAAYTDGLSCGANLSSTGGIGATVEHVLVTNQWFHLACSWDGSNFKIYVDGDLKATLSASGTIVQNHHHNSIGLRRVNWGNVTQVAGVDGRIDEVKIWKRAIDCSELDVPCNAASTDVKFQGKVIDALLPTVEPETKMIALVSPFITVHVEKVLSTGIQVGQDVFVALFQCGNGQPARIDKVKVGDRVEVLGALQESGDVWPQCRPHYVKKLGSNKKPVASFLTRPDKPQAELDTLFDPRSSKDPDGLITKFEWDLNSDGLYENPTEGDGVSFYTFPTKGTFKICLRVTDDSGGIDTKCKRIRVKEAPKCYDFLKLPDVRKWKTDVVSVRIDDSIPLDWRPEIIAAMNAWNAVGAKISYRFDQSARSVIRRGDRGVLGVLDAIGAMIPDPPVGGTMTGFEVILFNDVSYSIEPTTDRFHLHSVLLHELGHALGLAHTLDSDLCRSVNPAPVMTSGLGTGVSSDITRQDRNGLIALYGARRTRGTTNFSTVRSLLDYGHTLLGNNERDRRYEIAIYDMAGRAVLKNTSFDMKYESDATPYWSYQLLNGVYLYVIRIVIARNESSVRLVGKVLILR